MSDNERNYDLKPKSSEQVAAKSFPYEPPVPLRSHRIGLIGCGGISENHLAAYKHAGFDVVAFSDLDLSRAQARRDAFYPDGEVFVESQALLENADVDVVDIATPAAVRVPIIEAALDAGKNVLSQKPFVLDMETGRRLVDLADEKHCLLAVNQNGRWAPHLSFLREAVKADLIGDVVSVAVDIHWDHNWIQGTLFDQMTHVVLEDFAIHWFDFTASIVPGIADRIYASAMRSQGQTAKPPLLATALLDYPKTRVVLNFDADTRWGAEDRTVVRGTKGTLISCGTSLTEQSVTAYTEEGWFHADLQGNWFREGFFGTMAELLCAIEQGRQPLNNARDNLRGLAMCFAAVENAESHP
ncbi:putative oxidoreductase YdgJ [Planctomycetes bacterium CA13]|uniref:Putative oxidoreductase YdgJ n=1 Tax=Novipirellula herctigrandis TaxID=2527986 RepID=A0A5C5YP34_9BACT|nr:putative oxidoreductase YdgJ [Planctomycetes bacterium CA13]